MKKIKRFSQLTAAAFCCLMMLSACADHDNPVNNEVTDDKPFTGDKDIDKSYIPGNDYYWYAVGSWLEDPNRGPSQFEQVSTQITNAYMNNLMSSQDPVISHIRNLAEQAQTDDSKMVEVLKNNLAAIDAIKTTQDRDLIFNQLQKLGYQPIFRIGTIIYQGKILGVVTNGGKPRSIDQIMNYPDPKLSEKLDAKVAEIAGGLKNMGFSEERVNEITAHAQEIEKMELLIHISTYDACHKIWTVNEKARRRASKEEEQAYGYLILSLMNTPQEYAGNIAPLTWADAIYGSQPSFTPLFKLYFSEAPEDIAKVRDYLIYNTYAQDAAYLPSLSPKLTLKEMMHNATYALKYHMFKTCVESFGLQNIHKEECSRIMADMRQLFDERISKLDWMSDATKQAARQKLAAMKFSIGYPDQWNEEYSPEVEGNTLLEAVIYLRLFQIGCSLNTLGMSAKDCAWEYFTSNTPFYLDNAFYHSSSNMLIILPSWLTDIRFSTEESDAKRFATSFCFGHEMSHGFDAIGSKFDSQGALNDWWAPEDTVKFKNKQQEMIELYSELEIYEGLHVDGKQSLTENMADLGGVTLASELYKKQLQAQGYTQKGIDEQLKKFYLSYAQIWKSTNVLNKEYLDQHFALKNEPHADDHIRINGIARLMDDWYRIYDVKEDQKLYVAPERRVKIW